jgi:hypothetical protein
MSAAQLNFVPKEEISEEKAEQLWLPGLNFAGLEADGRPFTLEEAKSKLGQIIKLKETHCFKERNRIIELPQGTTGSISSVINRKGLVTLVIQTSIGFKNLDGNTTIRPICVNINSANLYEEIFTEIAL